MPLPLPVRSILRIVAPMLLALASAVGSLLPSEAIGAPLATGLLVPRTDFAVFGVGGLRGTGNGTVTVSGVSGEVRRAILLWHGVANTASPLSPSAVFAGKPVVGFNVGVTADTTWGRASSQAFFADVTDVVAGNGNYALSGMRNAPTFDPNGASLLVFYRDGNAANDRDVAVLWGNDSNTASPGDPAGWAFSQQGIVYAGGAATMTLIVSDGQNFQESGSNSLNVNGSNVGIPRFQGNTVPVAPGSSVTDGGLWDHVTVSIAPYLVTGENTLSVAGQPEVNLDALNLVGALIDLPPGTLVLPVSDVPAVSPGKLAWLAAAMLAIGGLARRRTVRR